MSVVVLGAGLSGLVAARTLAGQGHDVVVLEARDRVGGRLLTSRGRLAGGQYAELGAETVYAGHGHVLRLIAELDLEVFTAGYFDPAAPSIRLGGRNLDEQERRALTSELRQHYAQAPPAPFENLQAWTRRVHASADVVSFLTSYTQYTPVTSLRHADAEEFLLQLTHTSDSYRILGGNDLVTSRLAQGLDVRLGHRARVVDWSGSGVRVETTAGTVEGERLVVAVPGPLTTEIAFWPALPPEKVIALSELRYGTATKVVVQYAEKEAIGSAVGAGYFTDTVPPWAVNQSIHQDGEHILVSTLLGGDAQPADVDDDLLEEFDDTVAGISGGAVTRVGSVSYDWTTDDLCRVVVRAPLGDQRTRVIPRLVAPLGDRVFFAGEHTDDRRGPGGLEGATRSGLRAARQLIEARPQHVRRGVRPGG